MPNDSRPYDVVVIGGGLAGSCVAYHCADAGARTLLVDRRDPGRATDAGAGILSPETNKHPLDAWDTLVRACGRYYPQLVAALSDRGASDSGYDRCGLLTLALADWDLDEFDSAARLILDRQDRHGPPAEGPLCEVSPDEAKALYPPLGRVTRALWHPGAARVDGRLMNAAVLAAAGARGLATMTGDASLVLAGGRVDAVDVAGERVPCGGAVIAGGAWSEVFAAPLGCDLPVAPARGQIVHLQVPGGGTGAWPILQPLLGMYQVPWPDGRVAVGATVEPEAGFDPRPTAAGLRLVFSEVLRVAPGLADAGLVEVRVGLRPVSVDDLPIVGPVPGWANVHVATGYGANGLLLSPYCGRGVAEAALGRPADAVLAPFGAGRFPLATSG
jgi:D-amino-acid dehydrogenase